MARWKSVPHLSHGPPSHRIWRHPRRRPSRSRPSHGTAPGRPESAQHHHLLQPLCCLRPHLQRGLGLGACEAGQDHAVAAAAAALLAWGPVGDHRDAPGLTERRAGLPPNGPFIKQERIRDVLGLQLLRPLSPNPSRARMTISRDCQRSARDSPRPWTPASLIGASPAVVDEYTSTLAAVEEGS